MASKTDIPVQTQSLTQKLLKIVDDGNIQALKQLLKKPEIDVNGTNKHGEGALHIAAGYGRLEIVKELQRAGAKLDSTDKQGDTPLYWASRHGHTEVVLYLCENGVFIDHQDKAGETAAHVASRYGHPEVLNTLCLFKANLNLQDNDGDTPLLCACWHGFQNIVEMLVQSGASLLLRNDDGDTPLHVSAVRGYYSIVRYLFEQGSEMDSVNKDGHTPLHLATRRNHLDIVQFFCEQGCNLNIQDKKGDTPLHEACREGFLSLVYTLFAANCNLDIQNKSGYTSLHLAALHDHQEIARCLCSAGCGLNIQDNEGQTADDVAMSAGHRSLAVMLNTVRQDGVRENCLSQLTLGEIQTNRVRLLVCGASGVGKTTLITSLKTRFLRAFHQPTCGGNYFGSASLQRTFGFCVEPGTIPNAGDFSIWDLSGSKEYYHAHEFFLDSKNTIYILVYSLLHPFEKQLAQIRFWLAMIKSKHRPEKFIHYAGHYGQKPFVILVQSFTDNPAHSPSSLLSENEEEAFLATSPVDASPTRKNLRIHTHSNPPLYENTKKNLLEFVVQEFGHHFMFTDTIFNLDCRQSKGREIRSLRTLLCTLRQSVLKEQPWVPKLVSSLQQVLPDWRYECLDFPVLAWEAFISRVQQQINPLVSAERLQIVAQTLNNTGEIIYITEGHLGNVVVLNPDWLGQRLFGPALAPHGSIIPHFKSMTGTVTLREIQRVYPELDPLSVAHLMEHFELCRPVRNGEAFEFPSLIKMESLYGLWEKEPNLTVYAGLRLQTSSVTNIFSPSLFPRAQLRLRKVFSDDIEDQELTLWSNGLKCCRGEVEICVQQIESYKILEIAVRGTEDTRTECYALLQQFYGILMDVIHDSNPGTIFMTKVLSTKSLLEHEKQPHTYSSMEIFNAERNLGVLPPPSKMHPSESICDLLCCGCKEMEITAKSAPYTSLRDVPLKTRVELCRMLDPPEIFGRDWCLLALQLGIQEEVPAIDMALDMSSPTDKLLLAWERGSNETVVSLVDALNGIGRDDAAEELVNGLSPFSNPNSSLIVKIGGVVATSYLV